MAIYYSFGDALVGQEELRTKVALGKLAPFMESLVRGDKGVSLEFTTGKATTESVLEGPIIGFEPIGIGKPLTIQIRHLYTGNKARGFWGNKDMLVASATKGTASFAAAPRALNFMVPQSANNQNFRAVAATDKGTPLIYYSPALAASSSVVTIEVMFSSFPKEAFDALSQAFSAAAGIPVFAPASTYLMAGGILTKLIGGLGKSLVDGTPALKQTESIDLISPGSRQAVAQFVLLISDAAQESVLERYSLNNEGALALKTDEKRPYDGEFPYAVISLDGRENDEYKNFAPTAASAAELDKFYNIHDGASQPLGTIVDALKLYNDMKFLEKAKGFSTKLNGLPDGSAERATLQAQYDACVKNIMTPELQPKK